MKTIIFKITEIRCIDGIWKFYPESGLPPICIKDSLLPSVKGFVLQPGKVSSTVSSLLYVSVEKDRSITYMRLDFATLFNPSQISECTDIPVLPDAYRVTGKECMKGLQHNNCCPCCPWCKQITPTGYFTPKYPSESYLFVPMIAH